MGNDIDKGILKAYDYGLVQSSSMSVVNGLTCEKVRSYLKNRENLILGLHINLTEGTPLSQKSFLSRYETPRFLDARQLILEDHQLSQLHLLDEMNAQLNRFAELTERMPAFLDSHQHVTYLNPVIFRTFLEFASHCSLPIRNPRPFHDSSRLQSFFDCVHGKINFRFPVPAKVLSAKLKVLFDKNPVALRTSDCELDLSNCWKNRIHQAAGESVEVVCHPRWNSTQRIYAEIEDLQFLANLT